MFETLVIQVFGPILLAMVSGWASFKWGRKKTKGEIEREKVETSVMVVDLVNKQLTIAYDRIGKLEIEVEDLKDKNLVKEEKLDTKRSIIRAAYSCPLGIEQGHCPVLKKEEELEEIAEKIKKGTKDETTT